MTTPTPDLSVLAQPDQTAHTALGRRHPLGRHKVHDARSRSFAITAPRAAVHQPVLWKPRTRPHDQGLPRTYKGVRYGSLGSCTGQSAAKAMSCQSLGPAGPVIGRQLLEPSALALYSYATSIDPWDGSWPSEDTGSSGLAVAKAALRAGKIVRYEHAFTIAQVRDALQLGSVITGTWWLDGMDRANPSTGLVSCTGSKRGGHEYVLNGYDPTTRRLHALNSWGAGWGKAGTFVLELDEYAALLADDGDVTRLVRA